MAPHASVDEQTPVSSIESKGWQATVQKKQEELRQQFPNEWRLSPELLKEFKKPGVTLIGSDVLQRASFISNDELEITNNSASDLIPRLRTGELTSLAVTTAFTKRALVAQQLTSCLTETLIPEALKRAQYLDDYHKQHGKPVGPLHGLPISIKDSFRVKGLLSTVGYVSFLDHAPANTNSALVDLLLDLGAVIYVKTNIPQTMMTGDSENNIFGRTLNPHNTSLTAGGSSGGEGALVAFRGSPLGAGTDIAGSIRIPSLCCGTYGFKPTSDRVPWAGQVSGAMEGVPGIKPSAGPLANSFEDLNLFMSTVIGADPWKYDATASGAPWNSAAAETRNSKLTIGILPEHPQFPLHPPVRRALKSAAEALKAKGHEVVHLDQDLDRDLAYGNRLAFQYFIYGPHTDHIAASGEPPVKSVAAGAHPLFTGGFPVDMELGPFEKIDELHKARLRYSDAWRKVWTEKKLDVILTVGAQNTAVPHDTFGWPPYTCVWNLLDYPACILPYGRASKELDPEPFSPRDDIQPHYDPSAVDGAPCAIQIVAPRFLDEQCLAASRVIDQDIRQ